MRTLTTPPRQGLGTSSRSFRVGSWCWIVTGTGHTLLDLVSRAFPRSEDKAMDDLMRDHPFELMGLERSYYDLNMGFSLAMGFSMVFVGVLLLLVARLTEQHRSQPPARLALAMSAVALGLCAWLEPPPPIVLFTIACLAFATAARAPRGAR